MMKTLRKRLNNFLKKNKTVRAVLPAVILPKRFPTIYDGSTGEQCNPALTDSAKAGDALSEREMVLIYDDNKCPDCGNEIGWGPEGGMHQNVKCIGTDQSPGCGARFNMSLAPGSFPVCERLIDRSAVDEEGNVLL